MDDPMEPDLLLEGRLDQQQQQLPTRTRSGRIVRAPAEHGDDLDYIDAD